MTDRVFEVRTAPVGTPIPRDLDLDRYPWSRLGWIGDLDAAEFIRRTRSMRFSDLAGAFGTRAPLRVSGFSIAAMFVDEAFTVGAIARTPRSLRRRRCKLRRKRAMRRRRR